MFDPVTTRCKMNEQEICTVVYIETFHWLGPKTILIRNIY